MKYSFSNWNHRSGTIPVCWNTEQYINAGWYRHPDKTHGFSTDDVNYQIYGDNLGVYIPKILNPVFEKVFNFFNLTELVFSLSMYKPGMILPWHQDNYPTYSKNKRLSDPNQVVRVMVFLHNSEPGHQLWIDQKFCYGPAGSWFSWQGQARHMAANLGEVNRYVLQITGLCPN